MPGEDTKELRRSLSANLKAAKDDLGKIIASGEIVTPATVVAAGELWKGIEKAEETFIKGLAQLPLTVSSSGTGASDQK